MKVSSKIIKLTLGIFFILFIGLDSNVEAIPAFPGAVGFGIETPAGRGGQILRVTNLNSSGNGSLREAVEASGPRIVIFEVSGTIEINDRLRIENPFLTIAGQTAPSPGITLKGCTLTIDTHDVLIQHLRVRTGDGEGVNPDSRDCISIGTKNPSEEHYNIIVDHCSVSWSTDEAAGASGCSNTTFSNCIVSEPLNFSLHSKGAHSKAFISGNNNNVSLIANLLAHAVDRNPYLNSGSHSAIVNNLIYNPGDFNIIITSLYAISDFSIVGNVVIGGYNSHQGAYQQMPTIMNDPLEGTRIFLLDNKCATGTQSSAEDWSFVKFFSNDMPVEDLISRLKVLSRPLWPNNFVALPSAQVTDSVIENAGARPADRDAVDIRIINDVIHGSGRIINSQNDVGGWPTLNVNRVTHDLPSNPNGDDDNDGYTNIEEWLHVKSVEVEATLVSPQDLGIKSYSTEF